MGIGGLAPKSLHTNIFFYMKYLSSPKLFYNRKLFLAEIIKGWSELMWVISDKSLCDVMRTATETNRRESNS